jgi:hypothetical protein
MKLFATIILSTAFIIGCDHGAPVDPGDGPDSTFTAVQQSVFSQSCAVSGCHVGSSAPEGLDLSAGNAYASLVGVASAQVPTLQRVRASAPDSSYIIDKITGSARMKPGTSRMPLGRAPLSSDQIDLVRRWIAAGARND